MDNLPASGDKKYSLDGVISFWENGKPVTLGEHYDRLFAKMIKFDDELDDIEAGQSQSIWPYVAGRYE